MHKLQHRNISSNKRQGNMTPPKAHCTSTESKDIETAKMPEKEIKHFL
jgi:hypothetical protein